MDMVAFLPKVPQNLGPAWGKHPERQSCKESHRGGGQASDQAKTSEFQVGHQAWPADVSAPRAPTAGPGGGWVMSAMLETSPSFQGEGGAAEVGGETRAGRAAPARGPIPVRTVNPGSNAARLARHLPPAGRSDEP